MVSKRKSLSILFILVSVLSFASADFEDLFTNIYSVSTVLDSTSSTYRSVSVKGGAYLYIKGSGFSSRSASSNRVTLGDVNCPVIEFLTTSTQVVCQVPPTDQPKSVQLKVFVDDSRIATCSSCWITYNYWTTPQLISMIPNAGNPGEEVDYYGRNRVPSSLDVDYVKIGDYRCDSSEQNEFDAVDFSSGSTLPAPCNVPPIEAGYYNVTQKNLLNTGFADKLPTLPTYRFGDNSYDFAVVPQISSISNNIGSPEGQIITVTGKGFSSKGTNQVNLADTQCKILKQSETEIQCEVQPRSTPISTQGYHSGVKMELYKGKDMSAIKGGTAGTPTWTKIKLTSEIGINFDDGYSSRLSGYFKAPVTGNYKFTVSADDKAQLWISKTPLVKTGIEKIIDVGSSTSYRFFFMSSAYTQISSDIPLVADNYYYFEFYQQEYSGYDCGTVGVVIPNSPNAVSNVPEARSIKLTCPTVSESIEFKITAKGGLWKINLSYLSSDGKKIDSTSTTAGLAYNAATSDVSNQIKWTFGLTNTVTKEMLKADDSVTTVASEAATYRYVVVFQSLRKNGVLPTIDSTGLTGTSVSTKVTQLVAPSAPVRGTFTLKAKGKSTDLSYSASSWDIESKLRELGFLDPIRVTMSGDVDLGAEWRVQFSGDKAPVDEITTSYSLTGCSDPSGINVKVNVLQAASNDLFYEVIPVDFLSTADTNPQITLKSNGITASCPGFNCDYVIQTTNIPQITASSYAAPTLTLSVSGVTTNQYTSSTVRVFLGNVECQVTSYTDSSIPATLVASCPTPEAGSFQPKVHFNNLGYGQIDASVNPINIDAVVSGATPSTVNPNGGTVFTITGTGFPSSLSAANQRGLQVKIGSSDCTLNTVSATQITCTSTPVAADAALTVTLNGKTGTSSVITLLTTVPTIDTVSPNSVNPVLQTDITITGSNFDSTIANTKIYISNTSNSQVAECLPVSSTTTQITCKLLGAPTGSYNLYVKTSVGNTNSKPFQVKTVITSVSPSSGSTAGGTILTISGGAFSNDKQQSLVFIGSQNVMCDVVSSSSSQVQCKTRAKDNSYDETPQEVVVATRIVEESLCDTSATCSFSYVDALTPKVTSLDSTSIAPGSNLQIGGSGFNSVPAGSAPTVQVNGVTCTVVSNTDSQIVVTVPNNVVPSKASIVTINVVGKGDASFTSVNNTIQVTPKISSISPTTGSSAGNILIINGAGFQTGTTVKVGSTNCAIRSLTSTTITCRATVTGAVTLAYGAFTGITCGSCTLSSSSSQTPTVSSVTPPTVTDPSSFTLTVSGSKLTVSTPSINLVSSTDNTVIFSGTVNPGATASSFSASFSNVAAGTYAVEVATGAGIASYASTVVVPLTASATPVDSSIGGGVTLTIAGSGFFDNTQKNKNVVTVCGLPCAVTQSTTTSIQCQTPLFASTAVEAQYSNLLTPSLLTAQTVWSDSGKQANALDFAFTTSYSSTNAACFIGFDIGKGLLAEISEIKYFPDPTIIASKLNGTVIEGSNDNSTFTLISALDANAHDGWNTITVSPAAKYRYYRLNGNGATAKCAIAELQFLGNVLSDSTVTDLNAIACKAQVKVNDQTQETAVAVNYKNSNTAVLTSVSPTMGTTAGGTTLTLTGTGFITTVGNIKVSIDGVDCAVSSATSTQITCVTGAAPAIANRKSSLESQLTIYMNGQGNVIIGKNKYFYIDKWSETSTWGGITPPREGESVSIPAGQTILLDISPPKLKAIIIEGALIFDDANIDLHCEYIFIRNGRMQIGTWDNPIQNKITVTLHGTKESPQLPSFGNKVIALMEGILDIHGKVRSHTWTMLDVTANAGQNSIQVQGEVDWVAGEQIVIASTDHDHYQSESRVITGVSANSGITTITFTDPLKFRHYAGIQTIDGQTFEMRAEVGLLTRNVVIQGDEQSEKLKYGVHIMAHSSTGDDSSIARISYTEVRQAGQAFNLGRYAIHLHLIGNVRESYIIGNAVHHSYNRAVTIHGVHFLKVQKNVAYWIMGHTIFIEDGIETHNVIEDNLVINTIASTALLNTDQTPACFWITNPKNTWRRNHAAGSDRYGFWFDLREHPEGPSATTSICPTGETLIEFTDNQAHSCGRYGLRIFHELIPRTYPCLPFDDPVANPPIQAVFQNFLGWRNIRDGIIGERLGAVKFKNIKTADNRRAGIEISDGNWSPAGTLLVEDAWLVGKSPENAGDDSIYITWNTRGLITPKKDFFLARNVHFSNYGDNMTAIETCSHCEHPAATDAGARTSYFEGLTFNNVKQRVRFNIPLKEILVDNDGSLTGNTAGGKGVVTYFYDHLNVPGCTRNEDVYNGLVCNETVTIRRIEFLGLVPFGSFEMQDQKIFRVQDNPTGVFGSIPYRVKTRKSWATPFVTGYSYRLSWASRADFNELQMYPSQVINANDKAITLIFNHSEYREQYDVFLINTPTQNISNVTTLWDTTSANARSSGEWYHDVNNSDLYMVINGKNKQDLKVSAVKCRYNCPLPATSIPKDGAIRLWSNVTQWPNQKLPQDGDNVEIPGQWSLKVDVNTAKLGSLHIKGDLYFDDSKDDLTLTAGNIWVEGNLYIGTEDNRYTKKAQIVLTGNRTSKGLIIGNFQDVSNKVLAVTGNVTMFGALVNNVSVKLQAPAKIGATSITVPSTVDWKVGDEILITPTQRAYNESEVRTIKTISNGVITFDTPLKAYHFGGNSITKNTAIGALDIRAEVGILNRNIKVIGSDEDSWGGRIYTSEIYDSVVDYYYRGRVNLDGVEMKNFGQKDTVLAGLTWERVMSSNNGDSVVRRCVVRDSVGYQMRVVGSKGITAENNIFYKAYKHQVKFEDDNTNINFKNNLLAHTEDRGLKADKGDTAFDFGSAFYSDSKFINSDISGNIVAGSFMQCWTTLGGDCATQANGPWSVHDNTGHSCQVGWLIKDPNDQCNGISHFTGYKMEQGIATFFKSAKISASNLIISDTNKAISLNLGGVVNPTSISLKDSYVAGLTLTGDTDSYTNKKECSNLAGVLVPISTTDAKTIPPMPSSLPWYKAKSNHIWQSTFTLTGVTFENFDDTLVPGCTGLFALQSNHYASDDSATTKLSGLTLINVGNENKIFFEKPSDDWIGLDDCGGWYCTGITNIIVRDLDGSLTGSVSSLMPGNPTTLDSSTCTYSQKQNANICKQKQWGLLTFENLDSDALTRILSPVHVTSTNFTNDLNNYMDHVWDGFYTGLKRLSRFHSVVQNQGQYQIALTSTVPNALRWAYQGGLPGESVTVEYGYANPQSVKVTYNGKAVSPTVVKSTAEKVIKPTDPCGTNLYNVDSRKITLQLTGDADCKLDVALVNSIKATVRYDITVEEFFRQDGPTAFIDKMAAVLKINPASIRIVDIKSGSTIVYAFFDSNHQDNTPESDAKAQDELNNFKAILSDAATKGDLKILDAPVLNSSFDVNLIRSGTGSTATETITSGSDVIIIVIASVVGVLALAIGSYFAYKKYAKKRIVPGDAEIMKNGSPLRPENSAFMHTENPLVLSSRFDLSVSPSTVREVSVSPRKPEEENSPGQP